MCKLFLKRVTWNSNFSLLDRSLIQQWILSLIRSQLLYPIPGRIRFKAVIKHREVVFDWNWRTKQAVLLFLFIVVAILRTLPRLVSGSIWNVGIYANRQNGKGVGYNFTRIKDTWTSKTCQKEGEGDNIGKLNNLKEKKLQTSKSLIKQIWKHSRAVKIPNV